MIIVMIVSVAVDFIVDVDPFFSLYVDEVVSTNPIRMMLATSRQLHTRINLKAQRRGQALIMSSARRRLITT